MSNTHPKATENIREAFYEDGHILDSAINRISEIRGEVIEKLGFAPVFVIQQKTERFMPRLNFFSTADAYMVDIELPGVDAEEVKLTTSGDRLSISGVRSRPDRECKTLFLEQMEGGFSRVLHFDEPVNGAACEAFLCRGTLHVVLNKIKTDEDNRQEFNIEITET